MRYIKPGQFASELQVKRDAVYAWIASGELRAVNVARGNGRRPSWRIPVDAVAEFELRRGNEELALTPVRTRRHKREDFREYF